MVTAGKAREAEGGVQNTMIGKDYVVELYADKEGGQVSNVYVSKKEAMDIKRLMEDGMAGSITLDDDMVNLSSIKGVFKRKGYDEVNRTEKNTTLYQKMYREFARAEAKYRLQSPVEKAQREYYTRFMGVILNGFGIREVFGEEYKSLSIEGMSLIDGWGFTDEQRSERRALFDAWIAKSEHAELWNGEIKRFFVEYFTEHPDKSWCPYEVWVERFIDGKAPHNYFEKILIRHDAQVDFVQR